PPERTIRARDGDGPGRKRAHLFPFDPRRRRESPRALYEDAHADAEALGVLDPRQSLLASLNRLRAMAIDADVRVGGSARARGIDRARDEDAALAQPLDPAEEPPAIVPQVASLRDALLSGRREDESVVPHQNVVPRLRTLSLEDDDAARG